MTFKKTLETGERDPRIARIGRSRKDDDRTKREIHDDELIRVLRKLKSHIPKAIITAAKILDQDGIKPSDQIQASKFLMENYLKIIDSVYDVDDIEEKGEEIQEKNNAPVFSLTVIKPDGE